MESGYCNKTWQYWKARQWIVFHENNDSIDLYKDRLQRMKNDRNLRPLVPEDDSGVIRGSLGAVDCTRVGKVEYTDINGNQVGDPMYSEYIKHHAWKLSVITSNSIGDGKEIILHVTIHSG